MISTNILCVLETNDSATRSSSIRHRAHVQKIPVWKRFSLRAYAIPTAYQDFQDPGLECAPALASLSKSVSERYISSAESGSTTGVDAVSIGAPV